MDEIIKFLNGFNVQTILSTGAIVWYFNKGLGEKIDHIERELKETNTRISRLEGTVYGENVYKKID